MREHRHLGHAHLVRARARARVRGRVGSRVRADVGAGAEARVGVRVGFGVGVSDRVGVRGRAAHVVEQDGIPHPHPHPPSDPHATSAPESGTLPLP
eukprot:scaffold119301_cov21-Phaeocystis_antarctica.AAC.1